jgi:hypothetical protein
LAGGIEDDGEYQEGQIGRTRKQIQEKEQKAAEAKDEDHRLYWTFRAQQGQWDLEDLEGRLLEAQENINRLCPENRCVQEQDVILWEVKALESQYEKSQRAPYPEKQCEWDLFDLEDWIPRDPDRHKNCVAQRQRELSWLYLAYTQAKAEALQHCTVSGCNLLPQPDLEYLARTKIKGHEDENARLAKRLQLMNEWSEKFLPEVDPESMDWENPGKARMEFGIWHSVTLNGPTYIDMLIEWLEEQLARNGNKAMLHRCMDDEEFCGSSG